MRYLLLLLVMFSLAIPCLAQEKGLDLPIEYPRDPLEPRVKPGIGDPRDEPPPTIYGEEIDTETDSIVYVLDISLSMSDDDRITRAKRELAKSINGLSRNFRFSVVAYSCSMRQWSRTLVEANDENKASACKWVNALEPSDSTATGPAVCLALAMDRENKTVVLLTDGAPNCGTPRMLPEEHRNMIRRLNTQQASVHVFGIAATGEYRRFCQQVASDNGPGQFHEVP